MHLVALFMVLSVLLGVTFSKTVVITVGGNTTSNPGLVFSPESVVANQGDTVLFNFTQGNHTVTQSSFASPCIPIHETDGTANGFDSSFRDAGNGTAITNLPVTVTDPNMTIWFFDYNTCALGGVGGINVNESSYQTLQGFQRNAIRLNGTAKTSTSTTRSQTRTTTQTTQTHSSSATQAIRWGGSAVAPLLLALLVL